MTEWIDFDESKPDDDQYCKLLFDDGSESYGTYWADMGIFALTGNATAEAAEVTHWQAGE